jgi:hypothetical protein
MLTAPMVVFAATAPVGSHVAPVVVVPPAWVSAVLAVLRVEVS